MRSTESNKASQPATAPAAAVACPSQHGPVRFAALDFETADYGRDSACALSITVVEGDTLRETWTSLIRPPRRDFCFTYLHGIDWRQVKDKPSFADLWPEIARRLTGLDFVAAHNASFDRSVLHACCEGGAIEPLPLRFLCTVKAARSIWGFYPTTLADVCRQLRIPLQHHNAESDAQACARILLAARAQGQEYAQLLQRCGLAKRRRRVPPVLG